MFLKSQ